MWWIRQAMMHLLAETGRSAETTTAGLMAAATQGRQVEAIRVAIEYAQSAATGQDVREPRDQRRGRFRRPHPRGKPAEKSAQDSPSARSIDTGTLHALRQHSVLRGYLN